MKKKELVKLKNKIRGLGKEQDAVFYAFLKKNRVKRGSTVDYCLFDYCFNNHAVSLKIAQENGLEIEYGV